MRSETTGNSCYAEPTAVTSGATDDATRCDMSLWSGGFISHPPTPFASDETEVLELSCWNLKWARSIQRASTLPGWQSEQDNSVNLLFADKSFHWHGPDKNCKAVRWSVILDTSNTAVPSFMKTLSRSSYEKTSLKCLQTVEETSLVNLTGYTSISSRFCWDSGLCPSQTHRSFGWSGTLPWTLKVCLTGGNSSSL